MCSQFVPFSDMREIPTTKKRRTTAVFAALAICFTGLTVPLQASAANEEEEQPVMLIPLTSDAGEPTQLAQEGLESVPEGEGGKAASNRSQRASAQPMSLFSTTPQQSVEPEDIAVLTKPLETDGFMVAGVTWDAGEDLGEDAGVFLRVREDGTWSQWMEAETQEGPDDASESKKGTEPFITGGADAIQVQVTSPSGSLPSSLEVSLVPALPGDDVEVLSQEKAAETSAPGNSFATEAPTSAIMNVASTQTSQPLSQPLSTQQAAPSAVVTNSSRVPVPQVVSRAGWGADESKMKWRPNQMQIRASVIHHTAGTNNYSAPQAPSIVRGIYHYHAVTRGWGDIGYNFLIDKYGKIYEGRSGSLHSPAGRMPQGAHASGFNSGTIGLSAMGDFTKVNAPQVVFDRMASILAWQFSGANITANQRSGFISPGTAYRGKGQNLTRVFAHRDVGATVCPGNQIYSRISSIATKTDDIIKKNSGVGSSPSNPGSGTAFANESTFYLNTGFDAASEIIFRYGKPNMEHYIGDWDGDGIDTVAMRDGATFYVSNSNQTRGYDKKFVYGRPGDEILVGDWNNDGIDTFAVRRGREFHVKNSISGGNADQVFIYGRLGDDVLVGDWNGDGVDTFAVRRGQVYHVKNSIAGGNADVVVAYGRTGDEVYVGDYNRDGKDTLAVRRGTQMFVKNVIAGGPADFSFHYGRADDTLFVGDWTGRGQDTFGIRRG